MLSRSERRYRAHKVSLRRLRLHRLYHHDPKDIKQWPCFCEKGPGVYAKMSFLACRCSKHPRNHPRRDKGLCYWGSRARIYRRRQQLQHVRAVVWGGEPVDWDADEMVLAVSPLVRPE